MADKARKKSREAVNLPSEKGTTDLNKVLACINKIPSGMASNANISITEASSSKAQPSIRLPPGVIDASKDKTVWKPTKKIKIGEYSFYNYKGSGQEFNKKEHINVNKTEAVLIDNIWIAHFKRDQKHLIASLNGLCEYFTQAHKNDSLVIVFNGPKPGMYVSAQEAVKEAQGHKDLKYKKYNNYEEAQKEAAVYLTSPFFISPNL